MAGPVVAVQGWKFHADNQNTGVYDGGGTIPNNLTRWTFFTGDSIQSSPCIVNGVVYFGSRDAKLYAVNADTGTQLWNYTTTHNVWSSPAVLNDTVFFGSWNGDVIAVNAANGTYKWAFTSGGPIKSSPSVENGIVYIGSYDKKLYAIRADDGTKLWDFTTNGYIKSSPAIANSLVYFGSDDNKFYAVRASDGVEEWNFTSVDGDIITSSPAVSDGVVYFGSDNHKLYALDAESGQELWNFSTYAEISSSPAVAYGRVYFGSEDYNVYCLFVNGTECWHYSPSNHYFRSSPAIADGIVYIGSYNTRLYALNALTGEEQWNYPLGGLSFESSPAIADGVVYVGSSDKKLYAFGKTIISPNITSINPSTSPNNINQQVRITGSNFCTGAAVYLSKATNNITGTVNFLNTSTILCSFQLNGAPPMKYDLLVVNPGGGEPASLSDGFTVTYPYPLPLSINPNIVITGTNPFPVTSISGSDFTTGGTVNKIQLSDGHGYTYNHTALGTVKGTTITGTKFNLTGAPIGQYYIRMSKDSGRTWTSSSEPLLNITSSDPTLSGITPSSGPNTASLSATITGTNFRTGASVFLTNRTLTLASLNPVITSTKITCSFPLTGAPPSVWNLTVHNTDGTNATLPNAFTITNATPVISKVSPTSGFNTVNTNLTITGSSFRNGITAHLICDNYTLPGINLVKTGTTKVQYTFPTTGQTAGKYNLTLTNIDGSTVTQASAFELKSPSDQPAIITTFPYSGPNNAAIPITITGSNFRGQDSKTFTGISVTLTNKTLGTTITGTPTSKKAQKSNTLYYTLPLTGKPAGIYDLTVRNYDGSFWTNTSGFIITTTDPTINKISPASGYTTKGTVN